MEQKIIIGTRASRLALTQTQIIADLIREKFPEASVQLKEIETHGDRDQRLQPIGVGIFAKALEEALLNNEIDLAIHSAKDVPLELPENLTCRTVGERADARDCLVSRENLKLAELPTGARVGTSSPRRSAQILELRSDLEIIPLRGNIGTRLQKIASGEMDAAVLAVAGLQRLELVDRITEYFDFPTAAGQGALFAECRSGEKNIEDILNALSQPDVEHCVKAERDFLAKHGGGCYDAIGATAVVLADGSIDLKSFQPDEKNR